MTRAEEDAYYDQFRDEPVSQTNDLRYPLIPQADKPEVLTYLELYGLKKRVSYLGDVNGAGCDPDTK